MANKKYDAQDAETQDVEREDTSFGDEGVDDMRARQSVNVSAEEAIDGDKESEMTGAGSEAAQWKDKYMRLSAEFDNYRKRTLKEKMDIAAAGGEDVIKAILPVLDDIDRALEAMHNADDIEAVRSGIELISHKLYEMLKAKGLKEIEAMGERLDTDFHEAVARFQAEPDEKGKIIDVMQKGYLLKDKVIRHSKVVVGD